MNKTLADRGTEMIAAMSRMRGSASDMQAIVTWMHEARTALEVSSVEIEERSAMPTSEEVAAALTDLGGHSTARQLCEALVTAGHPRPSTQLAIQRAADAGAVRIGDDWTLTVAGSSPRP